MLKDANGSSGCNRRLAVANIQVSFKTMIISFMGWSLRVGWLVLSVVEAVDFIN